MMVRMSERSLPVTPGLCGSCRYAALNTTRFALVFSPRQVLATAPAALAEQVGLYPNPARAQVAIELPAGLSRQPVAAVRPAQAASWPIRGAQIATQSSSFATSRLSSAEPTTAPTR